MSDPRVFGRGDKLLEHVQVGGHVVAIRRPVGERRARLPAEEAAAVFGRKHCAGCSECPERLDPRRDVEIGRIERAHLTAIAAAAVHAVAPIPVLRGAALRARVSTV